jgi:UDP-GlcNAc:undecaprenyl-phosphate/decaprenyl-phosphate GlcNAc-1-phosphate transferase
MSTLFYMLWWVFPLLLVAFAVSAVGVFFVKRIATTWNVLDVPDAQKKLHALSTPLWGGIAPFLVFIAFAFFIEMTTHVFTSGVLEFRTLVGFFCALLVLLVGGMWDDVKTLPPRLSILFPLLAALFAVICGMGVSKVTNPFGDPFVVASFVSGCITFVWLLCVMYTTKLLDGVDGLATGVGLVGAGMIAALTLSTRWYQPDIALLSLLLFAVLLGFFVWNVAPAKIFLGEGGSTAIGFTLGALSIMGGSKFATLLLVMGLPALDVAFVMTRRMLARRSPFHGGDGLHFHAILQRHGWSAQGIVILYVSTALFFGITTLLFSSWQKIIALAVLGTIALIGMIFFARSVRREV